METTLNAYTDGRRIEGEPAAADLAALVADPNTFVWVDLVEPAEGDLRAAAATFGLTDLAVDDALHSRMRPKIERYEGFYFLSVIALEAPSAPGRSVGLSEIGVFLSDSFAITIRKAPAHDIAVVSERLGRHSAELARAPGSFFAYVLIDEIVDEYLAANDILQTRIEELEDALVYRGVQEEGLQAAFTVRRRVISGRRAVAPLREVLNVLARPDEDVLTGGLNEYFRVLYDHVVRIHEEMETALDLVGAALEAHLSVVSNRMNEVVLKVSAWAAIFALPTVIASIYGMNFDHMPELHWFWGYPFALALMLGSATALYVTFKRKRWL
jgi:magnesium transporter